MTKNYNTGMDPDRYQMKDLKRRVSQLEKQRQRDLVRVERLAAELLKHRIVLERLLPPLPPPGENTQ